MNDSKTTLTPHDDVPLVRASLVIIDAELVSEIRTEYVIIDEYLDLSTNPDISSESSNYIDYTGLLAEQIPRIPNYQERQDHRHHCHQEDHFTRSDVQYSNVDQTKTWGAWAAGTILCFLMGGGPSLSMVLGIGVAFCSQQEEGIAGDVARAIGDVALLSHEKFVQVNEKHNIVNNIANSTFALSRNCLEIVRRSINHYFLADDKNCKRSRQTSRNDDDPKTT